jgi:hypothetical protein
VSRTTVTIVKVTPVTAETLMTDDDPDVIETGGVTPALPVDRMRVLLDRAGP